MKNDNIKGWMENCMRDFIFKTEYKKLLTPEVVSCLTQIHEYKGQQSFLVKVKQMHYQISWRVQKSRV